MTNIERSYSLTAPEDAIEIIDCDEYSEMRYKPILVEAEAIPEICEKVMLSDDPDGSVDVKYATVLGNG